MSAAAGSGTGYFLETKKKEKTLEPKSDLISFILMHISDFFMLKILLVLSDLSLFLSHELNLISDPEGELDCGLKSQFTQNLRGQQSFVFIRQEIFPSEFCRCDVCDVM